jgi:hypothetical protein
VTAHGSPGGPLQFDRLEAALAATFHRNTVRERLGDYNVWIRTAWYHSVYLLDRLACKESVGTNLRFRTADGLLWIV